MEMTQQLAKDAIAGLKHILLYGPDMPTMGICFNLRTRLDAKGYDRKVAYLIVDRYSQDWEHYSGYPSSPIPDPYSSPYVGGWQGRGLVLRTSLMEHLVRKLAPFAAGREPHVVDIKSARSLRRYRAMGYSIQQKGAGEWMLVHDNESSSDLIAQRAPLRAVEVLA